MCMANRLQIGPLLPLPVRKADCVFNPFLIGCMSCGEYARCSAEEEFNKANSLKDNDIILP